MDKPTLQSFFVGQTFPLHQMLAMGTLLPRFLGALIPTYVDIMAGEEFHNLCQYIFQEFKCMLFGTINLIKNIKIITHHISLSQSARKFRIGSQCSGCMSRHFNFGNDRNETVGCILHNFLYFFLRIITPLFFSIVTPWKIIIRVSYLSMFTIRTYFSQFRVFLYFYSPSLVIRQMKMEFIQFIECHQIKKLQHFLFWQKITSYIHHSPTMRETGSIRNADSRNPNLFLAFPVTIINGCRHELQQRLDTIKKSCGSFIGRYIYPIGRNLQCIGLIGQGIIYR